MSDELHEAIDRHDLNRARSLLANGADANSRLSREPYWTPLEAAIEELATGGSVEMIRLLIEHGADVNMWSQEHDRTPLHCAVFSLDLDAIRLLLDSGASPTDVTSEGDSPLRWAVEQAQPEIAALLLRHGAGKTINESGGFCGHHALAMAVRKLDIPMLELLLNAGADPTALDGNQRLAIDYLPSRADSIARKWDRAKELLSPHLDRQE